MRKDIENAVTMESPMQNGVLSSSFNFPASFVGFNGHFPEQPVLPGVCLIQAVLVAAGQAQNKTLQLEEMVLAKFFSVVLPGETLTAEIRVSEDRMVRAKITRGTDRIAEIRVRGRDA